MQGPRSGADRAGVDQRRLIGVALARLEELIDGQRAVPQERGDDRMDPAVEPSVQAQDEVPGEGTIDRSSPGAGLIRVDQPRAHRGAPLLGSARRLPEAGGHADRLGDPHVQYRVPLRSAVARQLEGRLIQGQDPALVGVGAMQLGAAASVCQLGGDPMGGELGPHRQGDLDQGGLLEGVLHGAGGIGQAEGDAGVEHLDRIGCAWVGVRATVIGYGHGGSSRGRSE